MAHFKKLTALLLYFMAQVCQAQTIVGVADFDQSASIMEFNLGQKKLEITASFDASTGAPNVYASSLCTLDGEVYGITTVDLTADLKAIYTYQQATRKLEVLYTFAAGTKGTPVIKSGTNGLLYGVVTDPVKGAGIFEFNPGSRALKFYAFDATLKVVSDYYFCVGQDGNVYVFYEKEKVGDELSNYALLSFHPQTQVIKEEMNTTSLRSFYPMTYCDMNDAGNGALVLTFQRMGGNASIIVCHYLNHTIREIPLETKFISSASIGKPMLYKGTCYVMADGTSKKTAGIYKIDLNTGAPTLVAVVGKLPLFRPVPCVIVGDKLYGIQTDSPTLFEYDFTTMKFAVVGTYSTLKIRKLGSLVAGK